VSHQLRELSWSQVHAFRLERHHLVHVAARDTLRITVEPFGRLRAKTAAEVRRRAETLAECWREG
jgi:hypothetical protein